MKKEVAMNLLFPADTVALFVVDDQEIITDKNIVPFKII